MASGIPELKVTRDIWLTKVSCHCYALAVRAMFFGMGGLCREDMFLKIDIGFEGLGDHRVEHRVQKDKIYAPRESVLGLESAVTGILINYGYFRKTLFKALNRDFTII